MSNPQVDPATSLPASGVTDAKEDKIIALGNSAMAALKSLDGYLDTDPSDTQQENYRRLTRAQQRTYRDLVVALSKCTDKMVERLVGVDEELDKRGR